MVGDHMESYISGDLVLVGPGLPHTWQSTRSYSGSHEAVVVHFTERLLVDWPELSAIQQLVQASAQGVKFSGEVNTCRSLLQGLPDRSGLDLLIALLELLDVLATSSSIKRTSLSSEVHRSWAGPLDEQISRVLKRIADSFATPMSQAAEAEREGMTPAGLAKLFKRSIGRSFTEVVHEMRVAHACSLLRESQQSILDIAYSSGFNNVSNFNRVFRRLRGCSPREYRATFRYASR